MDCEYSLEPPRRGPGSNEYQPSMFWRKIKKDEAVLTSTQIIRKISNENFYNLNMSLFCMGTFS